MRSKEILSREQSSESCVSIESQEVQENLDQQSVDMCIQAAKELGVLVKKAEAVVDYPGTSQQEKVHVSELMHTASKLFGSMYKKIKKLLPHLPLLLVLYKTAEQPAVIPEDNQDVAEKIEKAKYQKKLGYITREDLDWKGRFVDMYLKGDFLKMYNEFARFSETRQNGLMSKSEIDFRENIAQNIYPYNYGMGVSDTDSALFSKDNKHTYFGKFYEFRENKKGYTKENVSKLRTAFKVREDLFRKYLGLDQYNNSIKVSEYRPTKAKNPEAVYWSFETKKIVDSIKQSARERNRLGQKNFENMVTVPSTKGFNTFADLEAYVLKEKKIPQNDYTPHLGIYITNVSYDISRKEKYISYYDIWDLDPPVLKDMGIDIDRFNFPFEIYGRIYESDIK